MSTIDCLIDTNILIYHTEGSQSIIDFLTDIISHQSLNISILTKIEFLGWNKHTPEGFEKCKQLIEFANIYSIDESVANKAIDLRRETKIRLADAVIAATALLNNFKLATRNIDDFKMIEELEIINPFI